MEAGRAGGRALSVTVLVTGLALSLWMWASHRRYETGLAQSRFREEAQRLSAGLEETLDRSVDAVYSVLALHRASEEVTREEFEIFATEILRRGPEIRALEWAPRIPKASRPEYEERWGISIQELDGEGRVRPAGERSEYFPVTFLSPIAGNEQALGLDLGSEPVRARVLKQALTRRAAAASDGFTPVQSGRPVHYTIIAAPVFEGPAGLSGYYLALLDVEQALSVAWRGLGVRDLWVRMEETDPQGGLHLVARAGDWPESESEGRMHAGITPLLREEARLAGKTWRVSYGMPDRALREAQSRLPALTLSLGVLLTLALCIILEQMNAGRRRLYEYAYSDSLTGLPNRRKLQRDLSRLQAGAAGSQTPHTALFLNIDRFKLINDSLGYAEGDHLLVQVADRLRDCVRSRGTLARIGADEFAVLVEGSRKEKQVTELVQRIEVAMGRPFKLPSREVSLTCSMGIASIDAETSSVEDLLRASDIAMHKAKVQGRNRFVFYETSMQEERASLQKMEQDLRRALRTEELSLVYQPIICLKTGGILGLEALLRWNHPELGRLTSESFIGIVEDSGLAAEIGDWVLRHVFEDMKPWQGWLKGEDGAAARRIHVNISPTQLLRADLREKLSRQLESNPQQAGRITLEITETVLIEDLDLVRNLLTDLRELGVRFSLDDFGTGYASFRSLMRLPIDNLKIDKSFVLRLHHSERHAELLEAMLTMSHRIGLEVTAEGVEERVQADRLQEMGCDSAQGFYYSRPMDPDKIPELLRSFSAEALP